MRVKNIPVSKIDIAEENVRKDHSFGDDGKDKLIKEHLSKFDLLQPVVVRFDAKSRRYKLLIGRRRFFALSAKGETRVPAVVTELEGAEAEAASLFENLIRKDLSPLEKAKMVKRLVDTTKSGITGVSVRYGLPKSTVSEWLSILSLPQLLQDGIEVGKITTYEAIMIARKPKAIQERLAEAASKGTLQETMSEVGVKRGAPRGLLTVRLVFDPRKEQDKELWEKLEKMAAREGLDVTQYAWSILARHVERS
jgi:ParB family transcriptional regulator, chromosome partitioning protein